MLNKALYILKEKESERERFVSTRVPVVVLLSICDTLKEICYTHTSNVSKDRKYQHIVE